MTFHHYICRLKQDNYDEIPKIEDESTKREKKEDTPEQITRKECVE